MTNVSFLHDDRHLVSTGGKDTSVMQWRLVEKSSSLGEGPRRADPAPRPLSPALVQEPEEEEEEEPAEEVVANGMKESLPETPPHSESTPPPSDSTASPKDSLDPSEDTPTPSEDTPTPSDEALPPFTPPS